jgi:hypothetical protein
VQTTKLEPVSGFVSVRCCTAVIVEDDGASRNTRVVLQDPPADGEVIKVRLDAERIRQAARARGYREKLFGDITTLFECGGKKLSLVRTPYLPEKRHGWLEVM